jgi:hypothetical protein
MPSRTSKSSKNGHKINQAGQVDQYLTNFLQENYLKESTLNFEKSSEMSGKLVTFVEQKFSNAKIELKKIFKFLKNGSNKYSNTASVIQPVRAHDNDLHFREFYNLKDFDVIDEAEEIATHLMSELSICQNPPIL